VHQHRVQLIGTNQPTHRVTFRDGRLVSPDPA